MTGLFLVLGKLFTWSYGVITSLGVYLDWILVVIGTGLLVYWCKRIIDFKQTDKPYNGDRI